VAPGPRTATAKRDPGAWRVAAPAGLAALILALNLTPITNNDLFLHLRTGALVLETGQVPRVDDYSALAAGRPFIAHEWLAGVVFRLVEVADGGSSLNALIFLKCAVALAIALALYRSARLWGASMGVALPCLALVMILAAARFLERPHIFAWLMLALVLLVLARRSVRMRSGQSGGVLGGLAALVPIQILWANLHGSFFLGPAVVLLAAGGRILEGSGLVPWSRAAGSPASRGALREAARLAAMALLLIACCVANPYGLALLRFPFALTGSAFMGLIYEWQPPYTAPFRTTYMAFYYVVWTLLGAWVLGFAFRRARRGTASTIAVTPHAAPPDLAFHVLLFAAFLALSLRMNRNVTDFALATFPGVSATLTWVLDAPSRARGSSRDGARERRILRWVTGLLAALAAWFALAGYPYSPSGRRAVGLGVGGSIPVAAADYLERTGVRGNGFNSYGSGAYLIYRFHPAVRVAMDSRNDVYGEALYAEYTRALVSAPDLERMLARIDASFLFIEWTQSGIAATAQAIHSVTGGWRPVYFDDVAVVYLREYGPYATIARRDRYDLLDPALFRPGTWSADEAATALRETDRAVHQSDGSYIARVMRIEALRGAGRTREARADEARIVAEDPPLAHIHALLGLIHLARGENDEAAARLRRSLALNPYSDGVREAYARAAGAR
jgi:tetratricopeptide (TPR) repeat protein